VRVIIAGSRDISPSIEQIDKVVAELGWIITTVLCGAARGADTAGRVWAEYKSIPVAMYPADWSRHGKSAGYKRNENMAFNADALIAFWDGQSKGTQHMINIATRMNLKVKVVQ